MKKIPAGAQPAAGDLEGRCRGQVVASRAFAPISRIPNGAAPRRGCQKSCLHHSALPDHAIAWERVSESPIPDLLIPAMVERWENHGAPASVRRSDSPLTPSSELYFYSLPSAQSVWICAQVRYRRPICRSRPSRLGGANLSC